MCVRYLTPDKMEEVQQIIDTLGTVSIRVPQEELVARKNPEVGPGVTAPIIVIGRGFDGKADGHHDSGQVGLREVGWQGAGLQRALRIVDDEFVLFAAHPARAVSCSRDGLFRMGAAASTRSVRRKAGCCSWRGLGGGIQN